MTSQIETRRTRGACAVCGHLAALHDGYTVQHTVRRVKMIDGEPRHYRSEDAADRVCAGSEKPPAPLRFYQPKGN